MDGPTFPAEPLTFPLRGREGAIRMEAEGLHHPSGARGGGATRTAYSDITHLSTTSRALWLGTRHSVYVIGRSQFEDPNGPENLVRALLESIADRPEGARQLARMAQVEEIAQQPASLHATRGLAVACAATYALQLALGDHLFLVGHFLTPLVVDGDWWRVVTANLLHGFFLHLLLNVMGLLALGSLVERPLGTSRTVCVMAVSAAGAMFASALATEGPVVGVSGVVFGLLGALLWLELRFAEALPAWWRVPRRAIYWMLGVSVLISFLPVIAGAAHVGGFLSGGAAAALLTGGSLGRRSPSPAGVRAFAAASMAVTLLAIGTASQLAWNPVAYFTLHAERLYALEVAPPDELNNVAWMIATYPRADEEMLGLALRLAERAVEDTERGEPQILDTLAEVHFRLGDPDAAIAAIEEAIALQPDRDYYREQRRRFLGERQPEDRPFYDPNEGVTPPEAGEEAGLRV